MRHLIALLLAMPFIASAGPITPSYDVVDLEYWGTLRPNSINCASCPPIAEKQHGIMRIDLRLAPPDQLPGDPGEGNYAWWGDLTNDPNGPSGFVKGDHQGLSGKSEDFVAVRPLARDPFLPQLYVQNSEASGQFVQQSQVLNIIGGNFLHGEGLVQKFDIRPSEQGSETAFGAFTQRVGSRIKLFSYTIDRLRATPKVCHG